MKIPEHALYGPRSLREPGSPDWCWQTASLLRNYMGGVEESWARAERMVHELEDVKAWTVIPPDKPFGSFDEMCRALLGECAEDVIKRIARAKRKSEVTAANQSVSGEVLPAHRPKAISVGNENEFRHLPAPQKQRAKKAGIHRDTQIKQDAIARERPDLGKKVEKREMSVDAAYRETKGKPPRQPRPKKTIMEKALRMVARMAPDERTQFMTLLRAQHPDY